MTIVTSYKNPDLDGVGAAVAYAEFLSSKGMHAIAAFSGTPFIEAMWVMKEFHIPDFPTLEMSVHENDDFVVVDTSSATSLAPHLLPKKVIEVIDHREGIEAQEHFPNADIQIELVGAAATLVAERLHDAGFTPSRTAAILLLGGIISNTMNFSSLNTTSRDHAMRDWLLPIAVVSETFTRDMFAAKTKLILEDLADSIRSDGLAININGTFVSQGQIEIVGVAELIENRLPEMRAIMNEMKRDGHAHYALLNCIDLDALTTDILVFDEESEAFYQKALGIIFTNGRVHQKGILLRKQMMPLIRKALTPIV